MPVLHWNEYDFIGCLEVEPTADEHAVWHKFEVHRGDVTLLLTVHQYESVVEISLGTDAGPKPLIELAFYVRDGVVAHQDCDSEWLEIRDCILAGSRFSYLDMGDPFDRQRYPHGHRVRIQVRPQIRVEVTRG